jgi:hypothetical protein
MKTIQCPGGAHVSERFTTSPIQFTIFRITFGIYLALHFAQLIPYGAELFSNRGVLADPRLNFTYSLFPNFLNYWDSPASVASFLVALVLLAAAFAAGFLRRTAAVLLWYGWACLFDRNNLINNPSIPYVGLILALSLLVPVAEPWSVRRASRDWQFPAMVYWTAWILMAAGYSFSGWMKMQSPSWIDGSALEYVLNNPLARPGFARNLLLALPESWLRVATWGTLALELLVLPLSFWRRTRIVVWCLLVGMNIAILFVIEFADLTVGMLLIHLFTYDCRWLRIQHVFPRAGNWLSWSGKNASERETPKSTGRSLVGCGVQ